MKLQAVILRAAIFAAVAVASLMSFAAPPASAQPAARGLVCVFRGADESVILDSGVRGHIAAHRRSYLPVSLARTIENIEALERRLDSNNNGCVDTPRDPTSSDYRRFESLSSETLTHMRTYLQQAAGAARDAGDEAKATRLELEAEAVSLRSLHKLLQEERAAHQQQIARLGRALEAARSAEANEHAAAAAREASAAENERKAEREAAYISGGAAVLSVGAAFIMARWLHWPVAPIVSYENNATVGARIFGFSYAPDDRHRLEFRTDTKGHAAALQYEFRFGGAPKRNRAPLHLDNRSAAERAYERNTLNPAGLR